MAFHLSPMMTTKAASERFSSHHQAVRHQPINLEAVCLAFPLLKRLPRQAGADLISSQSQHNCKAGVHVPVHHLSIAHHECIMESHSAAAQGGHSPGCSEVPTRQMPLSCVAEPIKQTNRQSFAFSPDQEGAVSLPPQAVRQSLFPSSCMKAVQQALTRRTLEGHVRGNAASKAPSAALVGRYSSVLTLRGSKAYSKGFDQ